MCDVVHHLREAVEQIADHLETGGLDTDHFRSTIDALARILDQRVERATQWQFLEQRDVEPTGQDRRLVVHETIHHLADHLVDHLGAQEFHPVLGVTDVLQARALTRLITDHRPEQIEDLRVGEMPEPVAVLDVDHAITDVIGRLDQKGQRVAAPHRMVVVARDQPHGGGHCLESAPVRRGEALLLGADTIETAAAHPGLARVLGECRQGRAGELQSPSGTGES